jgi:hypothetical protein
MSLQSYTESLPKEKQFRLAVKMARLALPIWQSYAAANELYYIDTVVGMKHTVDKQLLENTINAMEEQLNANAGGSKLLHLAQQFIDPIVALQDLDWELPNDVQNVFYSVNSLMEAVRGKEKTVFGESTIYVSLNQSIDAITSSGKMSFEEVNNILAEFKL